MQWRLPLGVIAAAILTGGVCQAQDTAESAAPIQDRILTGQEHPSAVDYAEASAPDQQRSRSEQLVQRYIAELQAHMEGAVSKRVDFEFPGGNVAEYVEAVRQVAPELNIVLHPEAERIWIPPVTLHNIPAEGIVTGGLAGFDGRDQGLALRVDDTAHGVIHITANPTPNDPASPQVVVFNLADIVADEPADPEADDEVAKKWQNLTVGLKLNEVSLASVLDNLAQTSQVSIVPNWGELARYDIHTSTRVSLQLQSHVPIAVALRTILEDLGTPASGVVYYEITDGLVRIRARNRDHTPQRRIPVNELLTVIKEALVMSGSRVEPAEMKYHADTHLLIVRGHHQDLKTINHVISAAGSRESRMQPRSVVGGRRSLSADAPPDYGPRPPSTMATPRTGTRSTRTGAPAGSDGRRGTAGMPAHDASAPR